MWAKFHSDNSVNKEGFSAKFFPEYDECENMQPEDDDACQHRCINVIGGFECECNAGFKLNEDGRTCDEACGGFLTEAAGEIKSPNWPKKYWVRESQTFGTYLRISKGASENF